MGTGGATALQSPELNAEGFGVQFWCVIGDPRLVIRQARLPILGSRITIHVQFSKNCWFLDIYIRGRDSRFVTPLQRFPDSRFNALTIHEFEEHFRASFCFRIISLLYAAPPLQPTRHQIVLSDCFEMHSAPEFRINRSGGAG